MAITAQELAKIMPPATDLLSDEPEMESSLHALQLRLLVNILEWHWRNRDDFFIGDNLTVFFSRQQLKTQDFRGPDFFWSRARNAGIGLRGWFGKKASFPTSSSNCCRIRRRKLIVI